MKKPRLKNNRHRFGALSLFLLLVCCMLAACTAQEEHVTELTLIHGWGSTEADHIAMRAIYMDYETANPGVRINLISMPSSEDVVSKVQDMLTVGEIPDIIFTGGVGQETLYRFMIDNGYAVNLTPYLDADTSFDACIADVTKARWTEADGALYTVSDVLLLSGGYWYNRDLFEQANIKEVPATWDDFTDVLQALSEQAGRRRDTDCSVILDEEHILYLADAVLADQTDEDLYRLLHSDIDFRQPPFTEVLSRLKEISRYAQTREQFTYRDTLEAFNLGKTAIYINGAWANTMIRDDLDVRYAAFPSEDGTGTSCISSNLGYVLGNTRDASRIDASVAFLKYMLSDDVQKRIVEETGQIASSPRIDRSVISGNERLSQAVDCVQSAGTVIDTPENLWKKELQTRFTAHVNTMLSSPDESTPSE